MQYNKNNRQETIMIEIAAWTLILGIFYIFAMLIF